MAARSWNAVSRFACSLSPFERACSARLRPDSSSEPGEPGGSGVFAIYLIRRGWSAGRSCPVRPVPVRLGLEHEDLDYEGRVDVRVAHERRNRASHDLGDRLRELVLQRHLELGALLVDEAGTAAL